jgi:hypothetical protein
VSDESPKIQKRRFRASRLIVLTGWVLLLTLVVGLVGGAIYLHAIGRPSEFIDDLAKSAVIFMFGAFPSMVRDFMRGDDEEPNP